MLPKADSSSFVLFSLLFVLTLTDPPRTGKCTLSCVFSFVYIPVGSVGKCGGEAEITAASRKRQVRRRGLLDKPRTLVVF